eukprot:455827_1
MNGENQGNNPKYDISNIHCIVSSSIFNNNRKSRAVQEDIHNINIAYLDLFQSFFQRYPCGGTISNVQITDNNNYQDTWITYDGNQYGYYSFPSYGKAYTAPLSVKITKTYDGITENIIYANNLVTF